ncbi:MAG: DUF7133 domain-containing protein, partial [Planctomycetota bacterium]
MDTRGRAWLILIGALLGVLDSHAQLGDKEWEKQENITARFEPGPSPPLSPEQAMASFELVDGFRLELVASEPLVEDPIVVTFDEDGRMWVVEMRGFMPNLAGDGEDEPVGRISILTDDNGDGAFDRRRTYLDGLVLPRALAITGKGVLFADNERLNYAEDRDGDGQADYQEVIDADYASGGNVEHRANGLLRGIDNWYYNAKSRYRYRLIDGVWVKEETEFRGQWGISHDNHGRLYYNYNWDQLRADLAPPSYLMRNPNHQSTTGMNIAVSTDQGVYPIRMNTGVNRGYRPGVLNEKGRLYQFASACSPLVYRGDQFPDEFVGDAFV